MPVFDPVPDIGYLIKIYKTLHGMAPLTNFFWVYIKTAIIDVLSMYAA